MGRVKFARFKTRDEFNRQLSIVDTSKYSSDPTSANNPFYYHLICIDSTKEIYTHGTFYKCDGIDTGELNTILGDFVKNKDFTDALNTKADITSVNELFDSLQNVYSIDEANAIFADKATIDEISTIVEQNNEKIDTINDSINTINDSLSNKVDNSSLNNYYTKNESDSKYALLADVATDNELQTVKEDLEDKINTKQDQLSTDDFKTVNGTNVFGAGQIDITTPDHFANVATLTGSGMVSDVEYNEHGHITKVTKRSLTETDIPTLNARKITSGTISIDRLPAGALERMFVVDTESAAMSAVVQEGDVVQVTGNDNKMYFCVKGGATTFSEKFREFTAGTATSVPWSGVTDKPDLATQEELNVVIANKADKATTLAGYGITDALSLSGGTLSNSATTLLTLSNSQTSPVEVGMRLQYGSTNKGWIGYNNNRGIYLYNYSGNNYLGIKDDGTAFVDDKAILHSGNYTNYQVFKNLGINIDCNQYVDHSNTNGIIFLNDTSTHGAPGNYGSVLQFGSRESNHQFFASSENSLYWRNRWWSSKEGGTDWSDWKRIAFTDYSYSKAQVDTKLGDYLPLSGGTLTGLLTIPANNFVIKGWEAGGESDQIANQAYSNGLWGTKDAPESVLWSIRNALAFNWYNDRWIVGSIRHGGSESAGFGVGLIDTKDDGTIYQKNLFRIDKNGEIYQNGVALANKYVPKTGGEFTNGLTISKDITSGGSQLILNNPNSDITKQGWKSFISFRAKGEEIGFLGSSIDSNLGYSISLVNNGGSNLYLRPSEITANVNVSAPRFIGNIQGNVTTTSIGSLGSSGLTIRKDDTDIFGVGVSTNGPFIWTQGENSIRIGTYGYERMIVSANGNVGIGTNNPTEKLEVSGNVKATTFKGNLEGTANVSKVITTTSTNVTTHPGDYNIGYSIIPCDSVGSLPSGDNANGVLTIATYSGNYLHQLGFTGTGLYHRKFYNTALDTTKAWNKIAYTSYIPTKLSQLTNDSKFINIVSVVGADSKYIQLGTIELPQQGNIAQLEIFTGAGYNAGTNDCRNAIIHIRTSNANSANNGRYYSAHVEAFKYGTYKYYIVQNSQSSFTLWCDKVTYTGVPFIVPTIYNGTYTPINTTHDALPTTNIYELPIHQIAYTDSNVASANKLATSRTLWGQSFNGTGNVDGPATMNGDGKDLYWRCKSPNYDLGFGIGSGNVNRGIYDFTNNDWWIYRDSTTNTYIKGGNVGIGTTNPTRTLDVNGTAKITDNVYLGDGKYLNFGDYTDSGIGYAYIRESGDRLYVAGDTGITFQTGMENEGGDIILDIWSNEDQAAIRPFANPSGSVRAINIGRYSQRFYNGYFSNQVLAAGGFYKSSDERLKTFENSLEIDLDKLSECKKSYFRFNDKPEQKHIGVSAQEIQKLYPEVVTETEDGYLSVDYSALSVVCLAAIDKLHAEIKELKKMIK